MMKKIAFLVLNLLFVSNLFAVKMSEEQAKLIKKETLKLNKAIKKLPPDDALTESFHKLVEQELTIQRIEDLEGRKKSLTKLKERLAAKFDFDNYYKFLKKSKYTIEPPGTPEGAPLSKQGKIEIAALMLEKITVNESSKQIKNFLNYVLNKTLKNRVLKPKKKDLKNIDEITKKYIEKLLIPLSIRIKKTPPDMNLKQASSFKAGGKNSVFDLLEFLGVPEGSTTADETKIINPPAEFKLVKKEKTNAGKLKIMEEIISKFNVDPKYKPSRDYAEDLMDYFRKRKKKVKTADLETYRKLGNTIKEKFSKQPELTKRKSYKRFDELVGGLESGFQKYVLMLTTIKKEKSVAKKIELSEDLLNNAPPDFLKKKDSSIKSRISGVIKAVKKELKKKWDDTTITNSKKLLTLAATKVPSYRKTFNDLSDGLEADKHAIKLTAIKKEKNISRKMTMATDLLNTAPAIFFKKKGTSTKKRIVSIGKKVRKAIRKTWNPSYIRDYKALVTLAKTKLTKRSHKKDLDNRIVKLYDKEKSDYNKAIKKINKANKKLKSLATELTKAKNTISKLEAKERERKSRGKKLGLLDRGKLKRARKKVRNHPKNKAKYEKRVKDATERKNNAYQRLTGAPESVRAKLKKVK